VTFSKDPSVAYEAAAHWLALAAAARWRWRPRLLMPEPVSVSVHVIVASGPPRLALKLPIVGAVASAVKVIVRPAEAAPAPFVTVMVNALDNAPPAQVRLFAAGLPLTNPGVYVQPVAVVSAPKVDPVMAVSVSVPLLVRARVPAAEGRK
jgi:hypothetical protein